MGELVDITAGTTLMKEGEVPDAIYVLITGEVQVRKGDQTVVKISRGGSYIGEMSMLMKKPATATVTASKDCLVTKIDVNALMAVAEKDPRSGLELASSLAKRLEKTTESVARYAAGVERIVAECQSGTTDSVRALAETLLKDMRASGAP